MNDTTEKQLLEDLASCIKACAQELERIVEAVDSNDLMTDDEIYTEDFFLERRLSATITDPGSG